MNLKKRYQIKLPSLLTLAFIASLGLVIGYLGPFGSFALPLVNRISYWMISLFLGYFIYYHSIKLTQWFFTEKKVHKLVKFIVPSLVAALLLTFCLQVFISLFFNTQGSTINQFLAFFPQVFLVGLIVTFISSQFHKNIESENTKKTSPEPKIKAGKNFLDRLPHQLGDELHCFVMEDHYLNVTTAKGEHMLLMRMKDALVELSDYDGLQVHRSWWIARDAVERVKKNGRNVILVLENGKEVPVSRTYVNKIKEVGLL